MALYRKWRSQSFADLVGQEHIKKTLQNVLRNRSLLSHAYLFCGPRGTGKTSTARIFAKALNCSRGISEEPCNKCFICQNIQAGSCLDVMEIDAASHTHVETVREYIIDKVQYAPAQARFKVYIIDEVHKLSNHSFNALLKTLEEPPAHVIFILATTHPDELPPTILSRCQRFDFRRIPSRETIHRMRLIAQEEGFVLEDAALGAIAQVAEGSLRDAVVVLEQAVSYAGREVKMEDVISLLGLTQEAVLFKFSRIIAEEKTVEALRLLAHLVEEGKDPLQIARDMLAHYRRLLLVKVSGEPQHLLDVSEETLQRLKEHASLYAPGDLLRITRILLDLGQDLRSSPYGHLLFEVALIKLTKWRLEPTLDALRQRVESLEKRILTSEIESSTKGASLEDLAGKALFEESSIPPMPVPERSEYERDRLMEIWSKVLLVIKKERLPLHAVLADTKLKRVEEKRIVIGIKKGYEFHKEQVERNRAFIEKIIGQFVPSQISVCCEILDEEEGEPGFADLSDEEIHRGFVEEAVEIFGGKIIS